MQKVTLDALSAAYKEAGDLKDYCVKSGFYDTYAWGRKTALVLSVRGYIGYIERSMEIFEAAMADWINLEDTQRSSERALISDRNLFTAAIGFYNFARVVLKLASRLKENAYAVSLDDVATDAMRVISETSEYRKMASRIVEVRNVISAHPDDVHRSNPQPSGWSSGGDISFTYVNLDKLDLVCDKIIADPRRDCVLLMQYIAKLLPVVRKCWESHASDGADIYAKEKSAGGV